MTTAEAVKMLERFRDGKITLEAALRAFQAPPVIDLGFARVDTHRALRKGFAEVIYGGGKTTPQVIKIAQAICQREDRVLITRVSSETAAAVKRKLKAARHYPVARCVVIEKKPLTPRPGYIAIVCAGTSDLPVAEEACVTAEAMGNAIERVYDAGVAGLHRLLERLEVIQKASVVVVVAGMEGALPSVVAGLVSRPVIAVPTSIGYGSSFNGLTPLLAMLNSCGSGVTVVNIDNGFGAAYAASQINALCHGEL